MNYNTAKCRITANSRSIRDRGLQQHPDLKNHRRFSYNLVRQELLLRNDRRRARTSELYFRPISSDGSTLTLSSDELQPVNNLLNNNLICFSMQCFNSVYLTPQNIIDLTFV